MAQPYTILNTSGPFREPRELVFSYDYSFQRPTWPMPQAARVKISIPDELDPLKAKLLAGVTGSPGQQMVVGNLLSRWIADQKFVMANDEGMMTKRENVMIPPFTEELSHLGQQLLTRFEEQFAALREEVRVRAKL
ncbi:MAG: hypothetical protein U0172_06095 [Nitrospiraceae bacterium]